jgi:uncharacterized protein involved in exopolysaccharide biosynthesis
MIQVDYMATIWRHKWIILLTTLLGALGAFITTFATPPVYRSTAVLRVYRAPSLQGAASQNEGNAQMFISLVNQPGFEQEVIGQRKLSFLLPFGNNITAESTADRSLFLIHASAESPQQSKNLANKAVKILLRKSNKLMSGTDSTRLRIQEKLLDPVTKEIEKLSAKLERTKANVKEFDSKDLDSTINQINKLLAELKKTKNDTQTLEALTSEINKLTARPIDASTKTVENNIEIANLNRKISNLERAYSVYWDYMTRLTLSQVLSGENLTVVSQPQLPLTPYRGNLATNLVIGSLLGILLGIGVAILMESRQKSGLEQ